MDSTVKPLALSKEAKGILIYLILIALGWLLPPFAGLSAMGVKVIFVFIACCYGWSSTSDPWPSLLALIFLPLSGVMTFPEFLTGGYGSDTGLFILLLFVLIGFLEVVGVPKFIASWMLSRKALQGRPMLFLFTLYLTSYLIGALINIFVGVLMLFRIVQNLSTQLGYKPSDKFPNIVLVGVGMTGALGLSAFPWSGNAIVLLAFFNNILGHSLDMVKFMSFTLPYAVLAIILYLLTAKFIFRLDTSKLAQVDDSFINQEDRKASPATKIGLISLFALVFLLLLPSFLPSDSAVAAVLTGMGNSGRLMLLFAALVLLKASGVQIFEFQELAKKIIWGGVFIGFVVIPLGSCLVNPATGIPDMLSTYLMPLVSGLPPTACVIGITLLVVGITNFMANMPVCMMFAPLALQVAASYDLNSDLIAVLLTVACTIAWLLPPSSPAGIALYGFCDGWLKPKDILSIGGVAVLTCCISLAVVYFTIGMAIF
jgi:sodium-dependent dicarboxylate transporter 2/3/5